MRKSREKKIVGIIQARMGASRLPGKMMLELRGSPIVEWVYRRASRSRLLGELVVAVPDTQDNDTLESFLSGMGAKVFRGSETDVVKRFYDAAVKYGATDIVRICADNPLISPRQIDVLIEYFTEHPCDYAYNHIPKNNTFPDGLGAEIVPFAVLERIDREAHAPSQREHVFNYIWDNPEKFTIKTFDPADQSIARPDLKLDIDTMEDYTRLQQSKIWIDMNDREIMNVIASPLKAGEAISKGTLSS